MAGIVGQVFDLAVYGFANARVSEDLDDNSEAITDLAYYDSWELVSGVQRGGEYRIAASNSWGIFGQVALSFKDDFYERIHIFPNRIDLGTVANTQTRTISVWNAYTKLTVTLDDILIQNGPGISIIGAPTPIVFQPLQELFWDVRITPNGPPEINASILFDFDSVADPLPVVITGSRAIVMPNVPEAPVTERWQWLTDLHVAIDGTEQRVGLRSVPRRRLSTQLRFESEAELREQYKTLLAAAGRLFVPYFQYSSTLKVEALPGDTVLAFDTGAVDLRDGDYILLITKLGVALVQTDAIGSSSVTLQAPLSGTFPKDTRVVGVFPSLLPNNQTLSRGAVNTGSMTLVSDATYPRSSLVRPGNLINLNVFDGYVVLERRPLANDDTKNEFDTGQQMGDAKVGLVDLNVDWDFTQVESNLQFLAHRVGRTHCGWMTGTDEMDYWREFCNTMRGSLNNFLLSTFRPDQVLAAEVGSGADGMVLLGATYAENFYLSPVYRYMALTTAAGTHYAKILAATKDNDGNTAISFSPSLPGGAGWNDIRTISYLVKMRIADDLVELQHWPLDTMVSFRARTVAE